MRCIVQNTVLLYIMVHSMVWSTHISYAQDTDVAAPVFEHTRYYSDFTLKNKFSSSFYPQLEATINAISPNVGGDVYYEFELPEYSNTMTEEEVDRLLFQALVSFRSQQGVEYFSYRRQRYRIFIEESYTVTSLSEKAKTNDMVLTNEKDIPEQTVLYVYQADSSFGDGIKQAHIQYDKTEHSFYVKIVNKETIKYKGLIGVAAPEKFIFTLVINRKGKRVQLYGITATHSRTFNTLKKRISISIVYRVYALAKWFERETLALFTNR